MARRYDTDWKETDRLKTKELAERAESYCRSRGIAFQTFGKAYCNDGHFLADILSGKRRLQPRYQLRLEQYLDKMEVENPVPTVTQHAKSGNPMVFINQQRVITKEVKVRDIKAEQTLERVKKSARRLLCALDSEDGSDFDAAFAELKRLTAA